MLNRDAILKLSPDELNARIWEAQGIDPIGVETTDYSIKPIVKTWIWKNGITGEILPDYAHSIAAAWGLVEEMADSGDVFIEYWQDDEWFVANQPLGIYDKNGHRGLAKCDGRTTGKRSAPLAISRAWLIWKQEAENDHSNSNLS